MSKKKPKIKHFYKLVQGDELYKLVNDVWKYKGVIDGKTIKSLKDNCFVKLLDLR